MPINGFLYPGAKFIPPYQVANSVRFNNGTSDSLNRTVSSASNRRTFTVSLWCKRSNLGVLRSLIGADSGSGTNFGLQFQTDDTLAVFEGSSTFLITTQVFRDPSAWSHFVLAVDTTNSTANNRIRLYHNGAEITSFGTRNNPSQNTDLAWNNNVANTVGADKPTSGMRNFFDGYLAEVVNIDGQQLTPTSFGEFDSNSPNIWIPKDVSSLTFGTNGFYLDFEKDETSTNFIDRSSNARTITAAGNVHHSLDQAKFNDSSIEFDGSGDNLQVTDSSDFDFGTGDFTFELFVYKQTSGKMAVFETRTYSGSGGEGFNLEFSAADKFEWYDSSLTAGLPGDPSAISLNTWVHYAVVRYNNVCTMYKNGTSVGTPKDVGSASQNSTRGPIIGEVANGDNDFDGYMDEIRLSNVARYTGNFTAPTSPFTSDSNTVLLIQSNASNKIGADVGGQGNHFESIGLTPQDQSTDTCTNNFAVMNPLANTSGSQTFSEGNTVVDFPAGNDGYMYSSLGFSSGKFYAEFKINSFTADRAHALVLFTDITTTGLYLSFCKTSNANVITSFGSAVQSNLASFSAGDIIGMAVDADNGTVDFTKNGSAYGSQVTGLSSNFSGKTLFFGFFGEGHPSQTRVFNASVNFGGSPAFSIASGNADANGFGNFEYSVPSNYFSLCTKNLAEFG